MIIVVDGNVAIGFRFLLLGFAMYAQIPGIVLQVVPQPESSYPA